MSLIISNVALHFLSKQQQTNNSQLQLGSETIVLDAKITQFMNALHQVYTSKGNKAYAHFVDKPADSTQATFVEIMMSYLENQQSFYQFSIQAANLLKNEIDKYDLSETGYFLVCHYEYMGGRYLMAAMIPVSEHYSVDHALNISADQHLDTNRIQLAARIDLFEYQQNPTGNRYISFIKGRAGRKVSDFFLDFLSCEEGIDAKQQSQTLVQAVEDFVSMNQLDSDEKQQTRKELQNYCKTQQAVGAEVSLQEISELFGDQQPEQDFYQFCHQQAYPIESQFPHDQSVINKATKYSGYGNGISVSFERSHFGQDVIYNQADDSLIIRKIPPNLKDQLLALLNN